jgi:4-amino-4-deoxy-L-arabinose transferase-like glycosyltransferase
MEPSVYVEKPPLKLWTVAFAIKIGLLPHNEFGLRFWDALFGAIAFIYVFLIGRRLVDSVCGFAAVFLPFTHAVLLDSHGLRSHVMEAALVVGYSGGVYHFLAWSGSSRSWSRWRHILAGMGCFTFAFMTKGIAAIFLPAIISVAALAFAEWRGRLRVDAWRWTLGAVGALVLIAPWFVCQHWLLGSVFW